MEILWKLLLSLLLALITSRVFFFFHMILIAPFIGHKCRKNNLYHTADGHSISKKLIRDDDNNYRHILVYEVNGKKYRMRVRTPDCTFDDAKVYYRKNPRGAVLHVNDLGRFEYSLTLFIILSILFFLVSVIF